MFAEAGIILRQLEDAVTIPLAALVDKEGQRVAFVVDQDLAREVRPVITFVQGERAVVGSGIEEGDRVVVIGQQSLSGGDEVTVAEVKE
jgi:membrane fusion protein (multidrug efflux system)